MKIYTVAFKDEGRFEEDIFTNFNDAEKWAMTRSKNRPNVECYIYIYSKDTAFKTKNMWYEGFKTFVNGICVRA